MLTLNPKTQTLNRSPKLQHSNAACQQLSRRKTVARQAIEPPVRHLGLFFKEEAAPVLAGSTYMGGSLT